ncbi:hypothetical protein T484DRAFT_3631836 [Baffinella frigidus]|nr:hypothetical protein T484DRAFT_3631836 [Cryptophyta sp. CCMP2293]
MGHPCSAGLDAIILAGLDSQTILAELQRHHPLPVPDSFTTSIDETLDVLAKILTGRDSLGSLHGVLHEGVLYDWPGGVSLASLDSLVSLGPLVSPGHTWLGSLGPLVLPGHPSLGSLVSLDLLGSLVSPGHPSLGSLASPGRGLLDSLGRDSLDLPGRGLLGSLASPGRDSPGRDSPGRDSPGRDSPGREVDLACVISQDDQCNSCNVLQVRAFREQNEINLRVIVAHTYFLQHQEMNISIALGKSMTFGDYFRLLDIKGVDEPTPVVDEPTPVVETISRFRPANILAQTSAGPDTVTPAPIYTRKKQSIGVDSQLFGFHDFQVKDIQDKGGAEMDFLASLLARSRIRKPLEVSFCTWHEIIPPETEDSKTKRVKTNSAKTTSAKTTSAKTKRRALLRWRGVSN